MAFTGVYPNGFPGYTFLDATEQNAFHPGIDWNWGAGNQDYGKPVQMIANGKCVHISDQSSLGYGNIAVVRIELSDTLIAFVKARYGIETKVLYCLYAHLKDQIAEEGKEYKRGDLIGYCGESGLGVPNSAHLHQELYKPVPGTTWRYWPTLGAGWTKEKLKQYYIDTYDFIEHQPSLAEDELQEAKAEAERMRRERDDNHNDRMALYRALGFEGDFSRTIGMTEIERLKKVEGSVKKKDEELLRLREELKKAREELLKGKEKTTEITEKTEDIKVDVKETQVATDLVNTKIDATLEKVNGLESQVNAAIKDEEPDWWEGIIKTIKNIFRK